MKAVLHYNSKTIPNNPIKRWAKDLNGLFSTEHVAYKHIKRCSTSVTIREMQKETSHLFR